MPVSQIWCSKFFRISIILIFTVSISLFLGCDDNKTGPAPTCVYKTLDISGELWDPGNFSKEFTFQPECEGEIHLYYSAQWGSSNKGSWLVRLRDDEGNVYYDIYDRYHLTEDIWIELKPWKTYKFYYMIDINHGEGSMSVQGGIEYQVYNK